MLRLLVGVGADDEDADAADGSGARRRRLEMLAIAPTDLDWFQQLRQYPVAGTINFWTPTPWGVKQLKPGHLFYFLLKSPIRKVGGWGTFVAYEDLPASDAWNRYGLGGKHPTGPDHNPGSTWESSLVSL